LIRVLSICGSPVPGSSTEILLRRIASAVVAKLVERCRHDFVRLSELDITACQACGEAPTPKFCFIDDAMTRLYRKIVDCDCLVFGSPIYFDSVSAQAKLFIDRCNCLRPANFSGTSQHGHFIPQIERRRPGAIILVGGERAWFEGARRCVAGFLKWIEVTNEGCLKFCSVEDNQVGEVAARSDILREADKIGRALARVIRSQHGRRQF
jgi:multimeric flavodoxin WrbA